MRVLRLAVLGESAGVTERAATTVSSRDVGGASQSMIPQRPQSGWFPTTQDPNTPANPIPANEPMLLELR